MDGVTTCRSLTTGVLPIACKTESRIGLLFTMIFSPRPAAAYAPGMRCSKIRIVTRGAANIFTRVAPRIIYKQYLAALEALRKYLLHQAFNGPGKVVGNANLPIGGAKNSIQEGAPKGG